MHMMAAEFDEAIVWGERALELATRLGAEDVAIHAQTNIGLSLVSSTSTERGLAMVRDSLSRALAANLVHDAMRIYFGLAEQFFSLGRYAEAHETYDALLAYAKRVQSDLFTGIALKSLVQLEWLTGRWTAALSHRQQLLIWMRSSSQPPVAIVWANRMLGTLHNDLGQAELARRVLELDLAAARSANELQTTVPHLAELARAYAALGREADAAGVLQELLTWVGRFPYVVFDCVLPLLVACWWFATQADSLDRDALGDCVTHLQRAAEHIGTVEAQAALAEGVGMALLAEGRPTQAAEQLQVAVVGWESLDRPYDQARALGALGITLQRAGQVSAARTAFDSALACYDSLATQLADPELKATFLSSPLVGELRITRSQLGTLT
jgi:tetratricopeptide (TPR) repeat protein